MKTILASILLMLASSAAAQIMPVPPGAGNSYNGNLANEPSLSYSKKFVIDMAPYSASKVSAQMVYSTVTVADATFLDGSESTGSITIVNYARLNAAKATDKITVRSYSGLAGASLTFGFYNNPQGAITLTNGNQWNADTTVSLTADSIVAAITAYTPLAAVNRAGVIYTTAPVNGTLYNGYFITSNISSIAVTTAYMAGGLDNATLTIGSKVLTAGGIDWVAATSNAQTATNLASTITAAGIGLVAVSRAAVIFATSTLNGTAYNYTLASSTTDITVSTSAMYTGSDPGFALNGHIFTTKAATQFSPGAPVLYGAGNTPAIGGLTGGTTYYVSGPGVGSFSLATLSTSAIAGYLVGVDTQDFVTITSTNSQLYSSRHTYTLSGVPWTGTASFTWQSSNDGTNYINAPSTGTVSFSSSTVTTLSTTTVVSGFGVDFGSYNYRYLRLSYFAPTWGSASFVVPVNIKMDGTRGIK